jgi:endonuclease/exonuclease/phosphatase family metal-dependent hydrolase
MLRQILILKFIHINELRENKVSGGAFTWSNHQADPTLEKLDRILVSREWELLFPTVHIHKESKWMSNHNPLFYPLKQ